MRKTRTTKISGRVLRWIRGPWAPLVIGVILISAMITFRIYLNVRSAKIDEARRSEWTPPFQELAAHLEEVIRSYNISLNVVGSEDWTGGIWQVHVPADLPIPSLHLAFQQEVRPFGADILQAKSDPSSGRVSLQVGWRDSAFFLIQLLPMMDKQWGGGKIALVIDDFGLKWSSLVESYIALGNEITLSVIPGERMSTRVAREAIRGGCEVILHLPMEPLSAPFTDNGYIILSKMPLYKIREVLRRSFESVPTASGVNNHMGSRVTSDRQTITQVLQELHKFGIYFLDSRTTSTSVAYDVAVELGMKCAKRDVFFDVDIDREEIRSRLNELSEKAKEQGYAIGIGHCHQATFSVLQEEMPKLRKKGFQFVRLSEVMQ